MYKITITMILGMRLYWDAFKQIKDNDNVITILYCIQLQLYQYIS